MVPLHRSDARPMARIAATFHADDADAQLRSTSIKVWKLN
jgi:hypothetical protein